MAGIKVWRMAVGLGALIGGIVVAAIGIQGSNVAGGHAAGLVVLGIALAIGQQRRSEADSSQ